MTSSIPGSLKLLLLLKTLWPLDSQPLRQKELSHDFLLLSGDLNFFI